MTRRTDVLIVLGLAILVVGFLGGQLLHTHGHEDTAVSNAHDQAASDTGGGAETLWTCSMHPQIKLPHPGKCPICGMDLIPVKTESGAAGGGSVTPERT